MNCMGKINMRKSRIVHTIVTIHIKQILLKYFFAFFQEMGSSSPNFNISEIW
jgi:hypothetical protein